MMAQIWFWKQNLFVWECYAKSGHRTLQQVSFYQRIITFNISFDRKVTKDQADMNAARSVRPLTAAANVNKNATQNKGKDIPKACIFVNASAVARRCWRPHRMSACPPACLWAGVSVKHSKIKWKRLLFPLVSSLLCQHVYSTFFCNAFDKQLELLVLDEDWIKVAQYLTCLPDKQWFLDKLNRSIMIAKEYREHEWGKNLL